MRRTLIVTLAVLLAAIAVCAAARAVLNDAAQRADRLCSLAVLAAQEHRPDRAKEMVVALAEYWRQKTAVLELLASHDALHEVNVSIAEARICLDCEDHDDFLRCMSNAAEALDHLRDEQSVRLSNLY